MDINDMRRKRAANAEKAQQLAAIEAGGTELSAEQLQEFETLKAENDQLTAKIERAEASEKMRAEAAKPLEVQGTLGFAATPKKPEVKGAKVARMVKAIGAVGHGGREAANYAENTLNDPDVAAALNTTQGSAGGVLVPQAFMTEIIELLTPVSVVRSFNPTILPMPSGNLTIPKMIGGATSSYVSEGDDTKASAQTFGDLQLSAKSLRTLVPISNELINYSGITDAIESIIVRDMVNSQGLREDLSFISGDGKNNTPVGLRHSVTAANTLIASDGSTVQKVKNDLGSMQVALLNKNVLMLNAGWIFTPTIQIFLMDISDGNGNKVFPEMANGTLRGYPFKTSNQITEEIYLTDFTDAIIGDAENTTISISQEASYIDPATKTLVSAFSRNQTLIRVISAHDFGMRHDESVAVLTKVLWKSK